MEYKADIHDAVKIEAFNAMVKAWKSGESYCRKAECITNILQEAIDLTRGEGYGKKKNV